MIEKTLQLIDEGKNIFITGGAGVGKSYSLNKILDHLRENHPKKRLAVLAMTGMASLQYEEGGQTVHSFFGIGFAKDVRELQSIVQKYNFKKVTRYDLEDTDIIFIDEISMMRSDLLELLDAILKYVMGSDLPFGGKQVVFCGDFMQLPPIVRKEEKIVEYWAFQSPTWHALDLNIIYLTEVKRQDDKQFSSALNMIRAGVTNTQVDNFFMNTVKNVIPPNVRMVKLLSTNDAVSAFNMEQLTKISLPNLQVCYNADVWGYTDKLRDMIVRDCPGVERLELRPGCQVMILVNNKDAGYVNGSMGLFLGSGTGVDMDGKSYTYLKVKLFSSDLIVGLPIHEWKTEKVEGDKRVKLAHFKQFPVKLAYAITIHKSQGMSIDYLEVDLNKCFAEHMAYVALSRARTYSGLRVLNWSSRSVKYNKDAFNFYMNLKNTGVI